MSNLLKNCHAGDMFILLVVIEELLEEFSASGSARPAGESQSSQLILQPQYGEGVV